MYNPNLSDPRVIRRIQTAYGFARGVLNEQPHAWSTRYIDRYFGQQQNPLSAWLREQLLVCTNQHYNKDAGLTKQYQLNLQGANYIRAVIHGNQQSPEEWLDNNPHGELDCPTDSNQQAVDLQAVNGWIRKEFGLELEEGTFNYKDKSSRLWHPLQSVRRIYKREILADYNLKYHYDIACAAPTLILQHAQQQPDPMDLYLFALNNYLKNRVQIRKDLAQQLEVDVKIVKILINALFCGARIGNNSDFAISQLLNNDPSRIEYLKQNEFICQLRDDIKTCWTYITPSLSRRAIIDKNSRERLLQVVRSGLGILI